MLTSEFGDTMESTGSVSATAGVRVILTLVISEFLTMTPVVYSSYPSAWAARLNWPAACGMEKVPQKVVHVSPPPDVVIRVGTLGLTVPSMYPFDTIGEI